MSPVLIWLFLLPFVASEAVDFEFENKLTYCQLISHTRIYKNERLTIYCALKVVVSDGKVRNCNIM
jgi:hypothetical protein